MTLIPPCLAKPLKLCFAHALQAVTLTADLAKYHTFVVDEGARAQAWKPQDVQGARAHTLSYSVLITVLDIGGLCW